MCGLLHELWTGVQEVLAMIRYHPVDRYRDMELGYKAE